jgi:myosin heavy subunit
LQQFYIWEILNLPKKKELLLLNLQIREVWSKKKIILCFLVLANAALLLGVEKHQLKAALCTAYARKVKDGDPHATLPQSKEEAETRRDSLACAIYTRLFNWLVRRMNSSMQSSSTEFNAKRKISLVEFPGFEKRYDVCIFHQVLTG